MNPQEILRDNNPFYEGATSSPWDGTYQDVASINREASDGILRLIRHKAEDPTAAVAALVLGEAGSGKTHIVKRILHAIQDERLGVFFAHVRPILDPETPLRFLLRELVVELGRISSDCGRFTQLDRLIAEIVRERIRLKPGKNASILPKIKSDPLYLFSDKVDQAALLRMVKKEINPLTEREPGISRTFLKVLIQYREPTKRVIALDWLKGDLIDDQDSELLGVRSRADLSNPAREDEARKMIITCGLLMKRYKFPAIICFDQLDILETKEELRAFERMIHLLVNDAHGLLPVAFARWASWEERFKVLEPATLGRLEGNIFRLAGCSIEQSHEIIRGRIESRIGSGADHVYQWLIGRLDGQLHEGYAPRQVILLANRAITSTLEHADIDADPSEILAETYRNECDAVSVDFDSWPPDADRLTLALRKYFGALENVTVAAADRDKYVRLRLEFTNGSGGTVPAAVIINTTNHPQTVVACLKRGVNILKANPDGRCFYISDSRCNFPPLPRWPATNALRKKFEEAGGRMIFLSHADARRWYALFSLFCKVKEGDVTYFAAGGPARSIAEAELEAYLGSDRFTPPLLSFEPETPGDIEEVDTEPKTKTSRPRDADIDTDLIVRILSDIPMRLMAVDRLIETLAREGTPIASEVLLEHLGRHRNLFSVFSNKQGATVILKRQSE